MSIFNELLPKINEISFAITKNFNDDLKVALDCFDKFEEEFQNGRSKAREKTQKDKNAMTTLQSINEDEDEPKKQPEPENTNRRSSNKSSDTVSRSSNESSTESRASKKRSKNEVDGISSPEQDKRQKRNASVKAQNIISKQVNVSLAQKLRRENSTDQVEKNQPRQSSRSRRRKDDEKENLEPSAPVVPVVQIKQEKISLPLEPESMDTEAIPINVEVKQEVNKDGIAMPPPVAPVPKPRRGAPKEKPQEETSEEETGRRQTSRTRKQTETAPPPVASARSTRASSRSTHRSLELEEPVEPAAVPEPRPKRTRGRKKLPEAPANVTEDASPSEQDSAPASPAEKPRPKRTRRANKLTAKEEEKPAEPEPTSISPKEEIITKEELSSPILPQKEIKVPKNKKNIDLAKTKELTTSVSVDMELTKSQITEKELTRREEARNAEKVLAKTKSADKELVKTKSADKELVKTKSADKELVKTKSADKELVKTKSADKELAKIVSADKDWAIPKSTKNDQVDNIVLDETRVIIKAGEMDQTMVLPNGVYNHEPMIPTNVTTIHNMNETVVLERCGRETTVLDKHQNVIMDATIVLDKGPINRNLTEDNSLLTDDSDVHEEVENTPPKKEIPQIQPSSAVKEKVQQFEEMASRVTRTKTRAMAKKEDDTETQTPPDKVSKSVLSCETLSKMNSLIFNGKPPQVSSSATKPHANIVTTKPAIPSSTSKLSAINRAKEAAEETLKREDARKKKEAMLEAKREQQRRKREEKMSAAAAAREAAERERRAALCAAARERTQRQAHADLGRELRAKDAERKRQELARKVAETEERRKAEEAARQQRLAEEQRRAMAQRQKQIEEHAAMKREAAIIAKEIEQKQREYIEKQKKQRHEDKMNTPFKTPGTPQRYGAQTMEPVYMEDGFQYLNSDEDEDDPPDRPVPEWSTSKARRAALGTQWQVAPAHVDRLFSVRVHSPDLRDLFPNIERARLKRTSSAVWRTPPAARLPPLAE